jgi:hypothetical protein
MLELHIDRGRDEMEVVWRSREIESGGEPIISTLQHQRKEESKESVLNIFQEFAVLGCFNAFGLR